MSDPTDIFIEIGHKAVIYNEREARRVGSMFAKAALKYPIAGLTFTIGGYDDDPTELWEYPEVMQYIRWFANASGLDDWRNPVISRLHEDCVGLLILSDSFAPDHPYKVSTPPPVEKFDKDKALRLRQAYDHAVLTDRVMFEFEGHRLVTRYAYYLLEYLEDKFGMQRKPGR
jgi:hypothetical protein